MQDLVRQTFADLRRVQSRRRQIAQRKLCDPLDYSLWERDRLLQKCEYNLLDALSEMKPYFIMETKDVQNQ